MKLWQKDKDVKKNVETFTVGKDRQLDVLLAPFDVLGSLAHIQMLESIGLLKKNELALLQKELKNIYSQITKGSFKIDEGVEDIHSQVEFLLTKKLGEVGKKIHSGRSRNDQVLLDLKLYTRSEIQKTVVAVKELFDLLIQLSEKHKSKLLPGYTHFQLAMPSSFGLWFGAYAESLVDDLIQLQAAFRIANKNPLGSAAGYGSSFPLNRKMTTELLGFEDMNYNVVYAQMGRGKTERVVSNALASIGATLAKMSMDSCLFMNQNFGFISFPDELTTGSSIMPHKKNPDVFELIRAKCNKIAALPNEIAMITANLSSGYHRDLQIIKENFIPVFSELQSCIGMMTYMLKHIKVKDNILNDEKYNYLFSVEVVNNKVLRGKSFRDAYKEVGQEIETGNFNAVKKVKHSHEGSIGNLCNKEIAKNMGSILKEFRFDKITAKIDFLVRK